MFQSTASATCSSAASSAAAWWQESTLSPEPRTSRSPRSRTHSAQNSPNRIEPMGSESTPKSPANVALLKTGWFSNSILTIDQATVNRISAYYISTHYRTCRRSRCTHVMSQIEAKPTSICSWAARRPRCWVPYGGVGAILVCGSVNYSRVLNTNLEVLTLTSQIKEVLAYFFAFLRVAGTF